MPVAFDISNACAGMWTGIYVVDAMIRSGSIRYGMVVSGEYISYLTDTAQKEIASQVDPQLASLTLGDAGLAVVLQASPRPEVGFHDIELYTLSKYSRFCIAKPTECEHGGAAMHTDAIKVTATVVPHAATHAQFVLGRNGRPLERCGSYHSAPDVAAHDGGGRGRNEAAVQPGFQRSVDQQPGTTRQHGHHQPYAGPARLDPRSAHSLRRRYPVQHLRIGTDDRHGALHLR